SVVDRYADVSRSGRQVGRILSDGAQGMRAVSDLSSVPAQAVRAGSDRADNEMVGGVGFWTLTVTAVEVVLKLAVLVATAVSVCEPLAVLVVSQLKPY